MNSQNGQKLNDTNTNNTNATIKQKSNKNETKSKTTRFKKTRKVLLTEDVKKINHIKSEHKRRNLMKQKHIELIAIVPKLNLSHPIYADEIQRIKTGEELLVKREYDPDLEFVLNTNLKNTDPEKQLEKFEQAIHAERSIYKLSKEYLEEQYELNTKLKEYIKYLISTSQIQENAELKAVLDQIKP